MLLPLTYQGAEVSPRIHQTVNALRVAVIELQLVLVEQSKAFLHRPDGGVDVNLRLPDLQQ